MMLPEELQTEYQKLEKDRADTLDASREYSKLTLPKIEPEDNFTTATKFSYSSTNIGAELVNNLASKVMNALFPPNRPFFTLELSPEFKKTAEASGQSLTELENALAMGESAMISLGESKNCRPLLQQCIEKLIITGNALLYKDPDNAFRVYNLSNYVIERSASGKVLKLIVKDVKSISNLEEDQFKLLSKQEQEDSSGTVDIYTGMFWDRELKKYQVIQALEEMPLEYKATFPEDEPPYIAPVWSLAPQEHYGRGLVENYYSDFQAIDSLNLSIQDFVSICTWVRVLVSPSGMTDPVDLVTGTSEAGGENTLIVSGDERDISLLTTGQKISDFQFVEKYVQEKVLRLARVFMLSSLTTRDAERVTAEEIRQQVQDLESNFGGIYSSLSTNLQLPYAKLLLTETDIQIGGNTNLELTVVAGLDALARASEHNNLLGFLNDLTMFNSIAPELLQQLDLNGVINSLARSRNVLGKSVLKSVETIQQEQAQAQNQELVDKVTDSALKSTEK